MRGFIFDMWCMIPFGHLLRFWNGSQRITLHKDLWITVDAGAGTARDSLPITFCSQALNDMIEIKLIETYKLNQEE